jgi:ABC-type multidrug transport system ATPase subunit
LIDATPKESKIWKRISGYAEQQDILNPWLSVIETLRFTAACRLPRATDREKIVEDVIRLVELEPWTNNLVGREIEEKGLPKHARKRLTIAVQLVMQPKILFLDGMSRLQIDSV